MESGPTPTLDPAPVKPETRSSYFDQSFRAPVAEFGTAIVALVHRALDAVPIRATTNTRLEEAVVSEAAQPLTTEPLMSTAGSNVDADCTHHSDAFDDCLNSSEIDDMGKCHYYLDMVANCCRNSTS